MLILCVCSAPARKILLQVPPHSTCHPAAPAILQHPLASQAILVSYVLSSTYILFRVGGVGCGELYVLLWLFVVFTGTQDSSSTNFKLLSLLFLPCVIQKDLVNFDKTNSHVSGRLWNTQKQLCSRIASNRRYRRAFPVEGWSAI